MLGKRLAFYIFSPTRLINFLYNVQIHIITVILFPFMCSITMYRTRSCKMCPIAYQTEYKVGLEHILQARIQEVLPEGVQL